MSSLTVVSGKLKKYNAERETFRAAIKKAFKSMDSDRTGRIFRRDIAVVVDAVFDAIELELAEYGLQLTRPTHEQMEDYVAVAGKLNRAQVTEKELFKFYCQVVKYQALIYPRGTIRRYATKMVCATMVLFGSKKLVPYIPIAHKVVSPVLDALPVFPVGPILGSVCAFATKQLEHEYRKRQLFKNA